MSRPRTLQELIHWLELGAGARWIRLAATLLGVLVLSLLVAWKQFHGATSETTLLQAGLGRQLAEGRGFSSPVNYPQAVAFLEQRGRKFDSARPYPELYHAPLYGMVIAGALRLLPGESRAALFASPPVPPDGFAADYLLLGINVVLLWLAVGLTFRLGRELFNVRTGWLAMMGVLLSVGVWQQTVVLSGAPLLMVLALAAFLVWHRAEVCAEAAPMPADSGGLPRLAARSETWLGLLGILCGLLFLAEYSAGALVIVALGYAALRFRGRARWLALAAVAAGFAVTAGPWIVRNLAVSGTPTGLAMQNVALKAGDPTAEPATFRNTLAAELPRINLNKVGNKTLTRLQESVQTRLWSGGAMWFTAFFVAGCIYTFRAAAVNRLRWIFMLALAVLLVAQAALNSGESERLVAGWLAPVMIVFGAGFFFVLIGSHAQLSQWPRLCATALLCVHALPLLRDALEPRRLHFQYPPYFPGLFIGMRQELERRDADQRFGLMADVPAGAAWYGGQRVWSQPVKLRDFYAITLEQPLAELLLTPRTLDRPFFSELAARPVVPGSLQRATDLFGEWGRIYAGLFTGRLPPEFPLSAPQKLAENLYVLMNPALPPPRGK